MLHAVRLFRPGANLHRRWRRKRRNPPADGGGGVGNTSQALPERNSNYLSHAPEAGKAFGCTAGTWVNGKLSRNLRIEMRMVK